MAIRGNRTEVVKILIELGAEVPPNMETGLTKQEMMIARWRGQQYGTKTVTPPVASDEQEPVFEEIEMVRCYGTDTAVLDADMIRAAREMDKK